MDPNFVEFQLCRGTVIIDIFFQSTIEQSFPKRQWQKRNELVNRAHQGNRSLKGAFIDQHSMPVRWHSALHSDL